MAKDSLQHPLYSHQLHPHTEQTQWGAQRAGQGCPSELVWFPALNPCWKPLIHLATCSDPAAVSLHHPAKGSACAGLPPGRRAQSAAVPPCPFRAAHVYTAIAPVHGPEEAQQQQADRAAASVECDKGAALLPNTGRHAGCTACWAAVGTSVISIALDCSSQAARPNTCTASSLEARQQSQNIALAHTSPSCHRNSTARPASIPRPQCVLHQQQLSTATRSEPVQTWILRCATANESFCAALLS